MKYTMVNTTSFLFLARRRKETNFRLDVATKIFLFEKSDRRREANWNETPE